jgi:hypothetical protein
MDQCWSRSVKAVISSLSERKARIPSEQELILHQRSERPLPSPCLVRNVATHFSYALEHVFVIKRIVEPFGEAVENRPRAYLSVQTKRSKQRLGTVVSGPA